MRRRWFLEAQCPLKSNSLLMVLLQRVQGKHGCGRGGGWSGGPRAISVSMPSSARREIRGGRTTVGPACSVNFATASCIFAKCALEMQCSSYCRGLFINFMHTMQSYLGFSPGGGGGGANAIATRLVAGESSWDIKLCVIAAVAVAVAMVPTLCLSST